MTVPDRSLMEFAVSHRIDVRSVPPGGFSVTLKTGHNERRRLAENHGLRDVREFSADFQMRPWKKRGIRIRGRLNALIVQECVVTAEPLESHIEQAIDVIYLPRDSQLVQFSGDETAHELFLDADGPDAPEIFDGNNIDIGAVAEEFFELAIDLYPRKPGTSFRPVSSTAGSSYNEKEVETKSPFSVLEQLKRS